MIIVKIIIIVTKLMTLIIKTIIYIKIILTLTYTGRGGNQSR